ncbi:nuclear transport factor 2 family protein [Azotobacter salinestris]|uniref:nuclear transport factor 2 family protein n=1 Tax=Azotobacter salinestris TaxID=69964 RepID=UPI0032E03139
MNNSNETESLIRSLEAQRYKAIIAGDFETFADLAHPELVYTHSSGVVDSLQSYLSKCREGFYIYHHIEHPIYSIKIIGDVALVFGEMNGEITSGGIRKTLNNRTLAVWTNINGDWRFIAYQSTPVK